MRIEYRLVAGIYKWDTIQAFFNGAIFACSKLKLNTTCLPLVGCKPTCISSHKNTHTPSQFSICWTSWIRPRLMYDRSQIRILSVIYNLYNLFIIKTRGLNYIVCTCEFSRTYSRVLMLQIICNKYKELHRSILLNTGLNNIYHEAIPP